ncbi:hypothetical protein [Vibrio barjaei]|uniref:hypothetical protein n=1 Tax=Vibrio barjaei TaxID=1676683 RepID=UPI002284465E|nr:hypothetical protein [Vibrio barjaei]MCY9874012.1 hypothetical protein [Vibrio barjaei]
MHKRQLDDIFVIPNVLQSNANKIASFIHKYTCDDIPIRENSPLNEDSRRFISRIMGLRATYIAIRLNREVLELLLNIQINSNEVWSADNDCIDYLISRKIMISKMDFDALMAKCGVFSSGFHFLDNFEEETKSKSIRNFLAYFQNVKTNEVSMNFAQKLNLDEETEFPYIPGDELDNTFNILITSLLIDCNLYQTPKITIAATQALSKFVFDTETNPDTGVETEFDNEIIEYCFNKIRSANQHGYCIYHSREKAAANNIHDPALTALKDMKIWTNERAHRISHD